MGITSVLYLKDEVSIATAGAVNRYESSSAQYILQQYKAASGRQKLQNSVHNAYAMRRVMMIASEFEKGNKVTRNRNSSKGVESDGFVFWQMNPDMWYVELALGGSKVRAGCNRSLCGGTHLGSVRMLQKVLLDLCAVPFR
ncbi:hypothetical protein LWI28_006069 [Acer negundo]|uniref:Uncharacterized protein n=1 Tax=Acer negundo TaxID=4023 RepID=A0AAD5P3T4_ACENE|nr:hypothetical protein LWI28_006069 [Acer negundo]